jgi:hypothetical protein
MASGVRAGAAIARSGFVGEPADSPPIDPWTAEFADTGIADGRDFQELDCVRHLLVANVLAAAKQRAAAVGVGADRVLITSGALSEETYLGALGKTLAVEFEPLDGVSRAQCPIDSERLIESASAGLLPLTVDDDLYLVVAPRGNAARQILRLIEDNPARVGRFRFTSTERLNRFVLRYASKTLATRASDQLKQKWPRLSAAPPRWRGSIVSVACLGLLSLASAILAPTPTMLTFEVMLAALVHPLFMAGLFYSVASSAPMWRGDNAAVPILAVLYGTTVIIGYLTSAFLGWLGLARRGLLSTAWVLILTPAHWLLLSLAAWRASYRLAVAPDRWEKTEPAWRKARAAVRT